MGDDFFGRVFCCEIVYSMGFVLADFPTLAVFPVFPIKGTALHSIYSTSPLLLPAVSLPKMFIFKMLVLFLLLHVATALDRPRAPYPYEVEHPWQIDIEEYELGDAIYDSLPPMAKAAIQAVGQVMLYYFGQGKCVVSGPRIPGCLFLLFQYINAILFPQAVEVNPPGRFDCPLAMQGLKPPTAAPAPIPAPAPAPTQAPVPAPTPAPTTVPTKPTTVTTTFPTTLRTTDPGVGLALPPNTTPGGAFGTWPHDMPEE